MKTQPEPLRVLLVDSNRHSRGLTRHILDNLGIKTVREASTGADALQKLVLLPTDLVICELNLEPMDGIEFVTRIRTGLESPNPYMPIIMITSPVEMPRIVAARNAGVHEILVKPISTKAMSDRIADIVGNPRPFVRSHSYFGPTRWPTAAAARTRAGAPLAQAC